MRLCDLFGRHSGHVMAVHEQRHLGPPAADIIVATSGRDRERNVLPTMSTWFDRLVAIRVASPVSPVLGLRANVRQFALLVAVSALVGGMVGQERTVLPLLATDVFGLTGFVSALTFVVAFGIAKAFTNLAAGALADRFGRKPVLVAGWLVGLPVPILIILAPSWGWIVAANLLLGVNQGLTWSTTVIMKIDLVGQLSPWFTPSSGRHDRPGSEDDHDRNRESDQALRPGRAFAPICRPARQPCSWGFL